MRKILTKISIALVVTAFMGFNSLRAQTYNITTIAGNGTSADLGDGGAATAAELYTPRITAIDGSGNIYILDEVNNVIRKINSSGIISKFAGNGTASYSGDGSAATAAGLNHPRGVAVDASGNVYIGDYGNNRIREVNYSTGIITTIAGNGTAGFSGDGGAATAAELNNPQGVAVDTYGNVYIADFINSVIRKVNTSGIISTIAGNTTMGYLGDGSAATAAELSGPVSVAIDASGNVYIGDYNNNVIRKVNTSGIISTIAGNHVAGYSGDGGAATAAQLFRPAGLAIDNSGNIYFADGGNSVIRKVNTSGIISTIAGNHVAGYSGDGGAATAAELQYPQGVAVDSSGNFYIADYNNNRIRKLTPLPVANFKGNTTVVCAGSTVQFTDTSSGNPTAWQWTFTGGTPSTSTVQNPLITYATAGTYDVKLKVSNSAGVDSITKTGYITVNPLPTASIGGLASVCAGDSVKFKAIATGNSPFTYNWSTSATADSIYASTASTYSVTVSDVNGCKNTATHSLVVNPLPTASVSGLTSICAGTVDTLIATVSGNGPFTYHWNTTSTNDSIFVTTTNTYGFRVTDANGCKVIAKKVVTVNPLPTATISGLSAICAGTMDTLVANAFGNVPFSYNWSTSSTSDSITVSTANTYSVTVTDANGCKGTATATVTVNPLPTITVNSPTICSGNSTSITSSGALTYSWNTGSTSDPITVNPTTTTNYTVTGTDGSGCRNTSVATVTVNSLPTATITGLSAICAGTMDTLVANASGNSPFTYNWSTSSTADSIEVSTANTYNVTVSDGNGCTNTATASVTVNPLPTITITGNDSVSLGHQDTLTATGGGTYVWTTGSTNDTTIVSPTTATVYKVTVTNSFGCTAVDSFTVSIRIITTGIANLSENNSTNLYPNPATTTMSLTFSMQGLATNATIEVLDVTGKSMMKMNTEISNGKTLPIDISKLAPGIYFAKITTDKSSQTIKFVKQDK